MSLQDKNWRSVCEAKDLVENTGVCVLLNEDTADEQQVALFRLGKEKVFAVSNYDPIGKANVMYRGIVGSISDRTVVASPLYKQHFDLSTGECLEDSAVALATYDVRVTDNTVELFC